MFTYKEKLGNELKCLNIQKRLEDVVGNKIIKL